MKKNRKRRNAIASAATGSAQKRNGALNPLRNPLAIHPLQKKGGMHRQSAKAARQQARIALRKECDHQSGSSVLMVAFG